MGADETLRNHLPGEKEQDQDRSQHPSGARIHRRPSTEVGCSFRNQFRTHSSLNSTPGPGGNKVTGIVISPW